MQQPGSVHQQLQYDDGGKVVETTEIVAINRDCKEPIMDTLSLSQQRGLGCDDCSPSFTVLTRTDAGSLPDRGKVRN